MKKTMITIGSVVALLLLAIGMILWNQFKPTQVGCTLEAKICPDGSSVGRTGPKCQFAPCPVVSSGGSSETVPANIEVFSPEAGAQVKSPLQITGKARGTWFFEASFPIKIYDDNGKLLGTAIASAQSDWMTTDFVPFSATITFSAPQTAGGKIIFEKDNPSGLPQNAGQYEVPVKF